MLGAVAPHGSHDQMTLNNLSAKAVTPAEKVSCVTRVLGRQKMPSRLPDTVIPQASETHEDAR